MRRVHEKNPESQLANEETVNQLGYQLLGGKQSSAAIEIFRLNTELHPRSGYAFDSLAEAYLNAGDKERARANYARALEVQPDYPNAKAARKVLRGRGPRDSLTPCRPLASRDAAFGRGRR